MKKRLYVIIATILLVAMLSGCEMLENTKNVVQEEIKGTSFTASVYDSYGSNTLNASEKRISLDVMSESGDIFSSDTDTKYVSSVLDVSIDGKQMLMVGDTVIFAESGLDMITDFETKDITSDGGGTGLQFIDRYINNYSNLVGKSKIVIVSSQLGVPIGVYQGDSVYVEIPDDLPKTTRLSIDGKSLYIHRANYQIIDSDLL